ncbi:hypothetical protein ACL00X_11250 [Aeromonas diversa]|uniref:hypothetical protein n=1 Tax=Aeromonas diversa TaxID=502790 RepID=UPI0039A3F308
MSKYRKGALYIRRMRESDQTESFRTSFRLAFYSMQIKSGKYKKAYVLMRHGDSNVMEVGRSRVDIMNTMIFGGANGLSKRQAMRKWGKRS